jgi:hypothetical protein
VLLSAMRRVPTAADHLSRDAVRLARRSVGVSLSDLRRLGVTVIDPILSDDAVAHLRTFAERAPARLRLVDGRVVNGTYADRPPGTVMVSVTGAFAWATAEVQHIMASRVLHDLVVARFGLAPVVHTPTLYWSCVARPRSEAAEARLLARSFHMDFDGVRAIRAHIYLTDVDDASAPMQYMPGSHRVGSLRGRQFREADFGLDANVVDERFGVGSAVTITGPAGTTFVTDPQGLHQGTTPRGRDRLFLVLPIQAGSFAGYVHRRRAIPVRDDDFRRVLAVRDGPLRLFEALDEDEVTEPRPVSAARLA